MKCQNCSGSSFEKITASKYRCTYCGSDLLLPTAGAKPEQARPSQKTVQAIAPLKKKFTRYVLAIAALALLVGFLTLKTAEQEPVQVASQSMSVKTDPISVTADKPTSAKKQDLRNSAKITNVFVYRSRRLRRYEIFALFKNTSDHYLSRVGFLVELSNDTGIVIANGKDYSSRKFLGPGESTPLNVSIFNVSKQYKNKISAIARSYAGNTERPNFQISNKKLETVRHGFLIRATLTNRGDQAVRRMRLIGWLMNQKKQVVGVSSSHVGRIPIGETVPIRIRFPFPRGKAVSFGIDYEATMEHRREPFSRLPAMPR